VRTLCIQKIVIVPLTKTTCVQTAAYGTQTHVAHVVDVGFMTRSVQKVNNTEFIPLGGIIYLVSLLGAIGGYVLNWF